MTAGSLAEIWLTPSTAAPMLDVPAARLVAGLGLEGDRYALGGGTWAQYPDQEKQLTLIAAEDVAAVARETGAALTPGDTRRNLVTTGLDLHPLVGSEVDQVDGAPWRDQRCGVRRRADPGRGRRPAGVRRGRCPAGCADRRRPPGAPQGLNSS